MSVVPVGPALRAVPGGKAVAEKPALADESIDGLTAPERRTMSRSVPAVIAELGFASRERVDEAMAKGEATGWGPLMCDSCVPASGREGEGTQLAACGSAAARSATCARRVASDGRVDV